MQNPSILEGCFFKMEGCVLLFITTTKDTFEIKIDKAKYDDNSTVIYIPTNKWRQDEVGNYLEKYAIMEG